MQKALYAENSARTDRDMEYSKPVIIVCYSESIVLEVPGIDLEISLSFEELEKIMEMVNHERTG